MNFANKLNKNRHKVNDPIRKNWINESKDIKSLDKNITIIAYVLV
jgi:hypothetical protein